MITKHAGTGGLVSVGTVTAQLLYEIGPPAYLGPDVTTHFDTITLTQADRDRVAEVADLHIDRFDLPNLHAINVVVHGLLGDGVASCTRPDPQAKGLGEYLRSRIVDIPQALLDA